MNKKKAFVCTIFFTIVLFTILCGGYFIELEDGFVLGHWTSAAISGLWASEHVDKFYNWLIRS